MFSPLLTAATLHELLVDVYLGRYRFPTGPIAVRRREVKRIPAVSTGPGAPAPTTSIDTGRPAGQETSPSSMASWQTAAMRMVNQSRSVSCTTGSKSASSGTSVVT